MKNETVDALTRAFQKAQNNTFFLANVLGEFQRQNHMNDIALAESLGCKIEDLPRLGLCRCPDTKKSTFARDVDHLAFRYNLQANQLANLIRQVGALNELKEQLLKTSSVQGMLLAARDREDDTSTDVGELE